MNRWLVTALLALAFLAAPLEALCTACCPESDPSRKLEAAMPCCAGDCEAEVGSAKPAASAVLSPRAALERPAVVLTIACASPEALRGDGAPPVFVSPSPPAASPPPTSVLRL